ncbi:MAG: membrane integrity-associated transporter subunit PqiC [Alphaproteobacteria bacterium]|nr:membrane integrity-associated transporter subunit PqiC [Alphaproteobacteria bacterium]
MSGSRLIQAVSVLLGVWCGGCVSLLPDKGPTPTKYALAIKTEDMSSSKVQHASPKVIKILTPLAQETYQTTRVVIRIEKAGTVQSDFVADVLWSDALPALMQHRLVDFITSARVFKGVLHGDESANADLLLLPTLEAFELRKSETGDLVAAVHLRIKLVEEKSRRLVATHDFAQEKAVDHPAQRASIAALEGAFNDVLSQMNTWLSAQTHGF